MWKCIGCDSPIPWDGKGTFSYTCRCGARIFYDYENMALALPSCLVIARNARKGNIPHLDGLIGRSDHASLIKAEMAARLVGLGAIWMKDCQQCRSDGTYQREIEREQHLAILEAERIVRNGDQPV